jgi:glycosyltransferase involved in cell wall biosynthesis
MGTSCGGTEVYEIATLTALHNLGRDHGEPLDVVPILGYARARGLLCESLQRDCLVLRPEGKLGTLFALDGALRRAKPDVLHSMFVTPLTRPPMPAATTVLDLGFIRYPEHYPPALVWRLRKMLAWTVKRADMIVCISEATKQDLLDYHPQAAGRVAVASCGVDPKPFGAGEQAGDAALLAHFGIHRPFLLFCGRLQPRKNIERLIRAYEILRETGQFDGQLVLTGEARAFHWRRPQQRIDASPFRQDIVQTGYLTYDELPVIYRASHVFVFTTLYEGFGIPVLEAMASGVPVVCSSTTSLPEVAGDAALLADPLDVDAISEQVSRAIHDTDLRSEMVRKGLRRVEHYTWRRSAQDLCGIYREMTGNTDGTASDAG